MNYLISCDWFQYCCLQHGEQPSYESRLQSKYYDANGEPIIFDVRQPKEVHPIYRKSYTLAYKGINIVHVHYEPASLSIPQNYVAVKVDNRLLYSSKWGFYLHVAIDTLQLEINNITRIDLCMDFQKFANGLQPYDFMRAYLAEAESGQPTYIRKHSNQFTIVANKTIKSDLHPVGTNYFADYREIDMGKDKKPIEVGFKEGDTLHACYPFFQTIRWGNRSSSVMVELYNKTKELKDKHHKPYIAEAWQEYCVIEDENLPVYRLEISITSKGMNYKRKGAIVPGEKINNDTFEKLCYNDFDSQAKIEAVFWSYAAEYFCFYEFRGTCKYKKDMPIVPLFPQECLQQVYMKPVSISRSHDTGRSERLAATTLERLVDVLVDLPDADPAALKKVAKMLSHISALKSARVLKKSQREQQEARDNAYNEFEQRVDEAWGNQHYDAERAPFHDNNFSNGEFNDLQKSALDERTYHRPKGILERLREEQLCACSPSASSPSPEGCEVRATQDDDVLGDDEIIYGPYAYGSIY